MLTRKHFIALAQIVGEREALDYNSTTLSQLVDRSLFNAVAKFCQMNGPTFNIQSFVDEVDRVRNAKINPGH